MPASIVQYDVHRLCTPPSEGVQGTAVFKGKRPNPWAKCFTPAAPTAKEAAVRGN